MTPKNKKVSTKFRANLYAFTCIACILWFAQSYADFRKAGTLTSAPSIFLLVCIGIVVAYTGVEAIILWVRPSEKERKEMQDDRDESDSRAGDGHSSQDEPAGSGNTANRSSQTGVAVKGSVTVKEAR